MALGLIALVVIVILGVGWYGFSKFFSSDGNTVPVDDFNTESGAEADMPDGEDRGARPTDENIQEEQKPAERIVDSDQDGLTDEEEEALGMKINSVDSDDDGLFDREEVKVYKTDPLNPDTDGDGYLDGEEVKNGYNPKGAGKLYEIR
jgi:hypothetical protein